MEIQRLGESLGKKEPPTLTMGTLVLKELTHLLERAENGRRQPVGIHEVSSQAGHSCERTVDCWGH